MKIRSNESINSKRLRVRSIIDHLSKEYPDVTIQLEFGNPLELLVATILSAQCTDARVNIVTKDLFAKYKKPQDYIDVPLQELEKDIFSTGFYRAKAKNIRKSAQVIIDDYNGNVPDNMEELLKLPGVGRKTANVILGHCFNTPGIVVDTHVIRISNRLGLVREKNPIKIEFELMEIIEENQWVIFTHYLINHGRKICTGRNAKCIECSLIELCAQNI